MTRLARRAFDHRADLLAALVYGCLAYLSFNALADYANAHALFPEPGGGWAFAVAVDGTVLYAFISFKRAPWVAGLLLVSGAAATYTLQRWHAQGALHPLMVAGVVPGAMILVTFAWHRIRAWRPVWEPTPLGHPVPEPAPPDPDPEPAPDPEPRPKVRTNGAAFTPAQLNQIRGWVVEERPVRWMARELHLDDNTRTRKLAPLVRSLKGDLVRPGGGS
jgi:hypothetical protein